MGLDIWFAEDIRNILLAANEVSARAAALVADLRLDADIVANLRAYREGYKAALCTVALAFGLNPNVIQQGVDILVIPTKGLCHDQERDDPQSAHLGHGQFVGRPGRPESGL